jgi:hypothetical protein
MTRRPHRARTSYAAPVSALLAALLACAPCTRVHAESRVDLTLARALFDEGVTHAEHGDWSAAADRFERAYAIKSSPGVAYNWASALAALGQLVHATELLDRALRDESADEALRAECEALRSSLAPRLAHLRVTMAGQATDDTELWVDGARWPRPAWGVSSPMDPGAHVARRLERGSEVARLELTLAEGEDRSLELDAPRLAPSTPRVAVASQDAAPGPTATRSERPLYKNPWLWTSVGVAVVAGVVVGVVKASQGGGTETEAPVSGNVGDGVIRW